MKQMKIDDAVWLYIEPPGESMHVTLVSVYEPGEHGPLTRDELEAHLEDRVLSRIDVLRRRIKQVPLHLDFPYLVDEPHLDLRHHVHARQIAAPGDWRALLATAVDAHAAPMDKRHPLWDFTLLTGLDRVEGLPEGSFAIASRFHHAMVDGKSIIALTGLLHDVTPDYQPPANGRRGRRPAESGPSHVQVAYRAAKHAAVHPVEMITGIASSLPALGGHYLRRRALPKLPRPGAPRTRFNGPATAQRRIGFVEFDLDQVRALRALVPGSTLNDVALTVIGGAMRAYLQEVGELPSQSLVTACPISVRQEVSDTPALGNQVSVMFVPLATDLAEPVERLQAIAARTSEAKAAGDGVPAKLLTDIHGNMHATASAAASRLGVLAAQQIALTNTIVSNVPGPPQPIYLAGRRLRMNLGAVALLGGLNLIHIITSYDSKLAINFIVDVEAMPDVEHYEGLLRAAVAELETSLAASHSHQVSAS